FAVVLVGMLLMASGMVVIGQYADGNVALLARTVAYTVEPAIVFGDRDAVLQGISSVADISSVRRVEVRDPAGAAIAVWNRPETGIEARLEWLGDRLLRRSRTEMAIARGERKVGVVVVEGASSLML